MFYERAEENLRDGVSLRMRRLGPVEQVAYDSLATVSVPQEQRQTLRAAIESGYYETPREVTIAELAE